ncbi:MAG: radical SAM protein [Methanomassiliicoccaceae archaeon]|nr:radical SAM protein [Methanomassiliicoccaceae archaeon]
MYGSRFNIAEIEFGCEIYGPGRRTVIWFQGCSLKCKGCWNWPMWSTSPNKIIERDDLLKIIIENRCDGVTLLGGEPLQQAENLLWLMHELKAKHIDIMLYTGYEEKEISTFAIFSEICECADILITGRYMEEERNISLQWRGSENQKIFFKDGNSIKEECNQIEIRIEEDGSITCLGYPIEDVKNILESDLYGVSCRK